MSARPQDVRRRRPLPGRLPALLTRRQPGPTHRRPNAALGDARAADARQRPHAAGLQAPHVAAGAPGRGAHGRDPPAAAAAAALQGPPGAGQGPAVGLVGRGAPDHQPAAGNPRELQGGQAAQERTPRQEEGRRQEEEEGSVPGAAARSRLVEAREAPLSAEACVERSGRLNSRLAVWKEKRKTNIYCVHRKQ